MKILLALFTLLSFAAMANEAQVNWTAPTERTDDTPLTNLAAFRVLWGSQSGIYSDSVLIEDPTVTQYTVTNLPYGTTYFVVTAIDANGLESQYSNEASKTFVEAPAVPPELWVQDGALVVYALVQTTDQFALVPVGTIPAGTPCNVAQFIRDVNDVLAYVVPREAVAWAGNVQPRVVVAQCGN